MSFRSQIIFHHHSDDATRNLNDYEASLSLDPLVEGVEYSEAGWSTDFAVSLLAALFFVTSLKSYDKSGSKHFMYMHLGTAFSFFWGGLTHALYPNRANDGTGMVGFYVTIFLGYCGTCMRYGLGWGLPRCWAYIALLNVIWLLVTAVFAIVMMERTNNRLDNSVSGDPFRPDMAFALGELFSVVMEILACCYYACKVDTNFYAKMAAFWNSSGWLVVYGLGVWSLTTGNDYDTRISQLIFHYGMMIFSWSINELALTKKSQSGGVTPHHERKNESTLTLNETIREETEAHDGDDVSEEV